MPPLGERLATLDATVRDIAQRLEHVEDVLTGEGSVPYDRSVRGRLHKIETTLAGMVLRRNYGVGLLKGWERFALTLCGIATVAASWYAALSH